MLLFPISAKLLLLLPPPQATNAPAVPRVAKLPLNDFLNDTESLSMKTGTNHIDIDLLSPEPRDTWHHGRYRGKTFKPVAKCGREKHYKLLCEGPRFGTNDPIGQQVGKIDLLSMNWLQGTQGGPFRNLNVENKSQEVLQQVVEI